jgi:serine/threonine protein kinase
VTWQFGPYRMEGLIARGGMGEVHRAYDTRHDRVVALKLLTDHAATDEDFRKRFKREAHAAARLREPHVIPIHAYGEIDGRLYLDMRLVEGGNLSDALSKNGPMNPAKAVDVIGQVASALDAAHGEGLVHRDVKPSNVLLQDNFAYLVDFGIARPLTANTDITGTGDAVGTLGYMAPERFGSGPVDHRVDVYALACMLFQCLTGTKPFSAENALAVVFAHANNEPPKASERLPGVPPSLDWVIVRGMAKAPADRFASAGELASAAREALHTPATRRMRTVPVTTSPPPPPPKPSTPVKPAGRSRWLFATIAAAIVVLVSAAGITWFISNRSGNTTLPPATTQSTSTTAPSTSLAAGATNPPCDGSYVVIIGSAVNAANQASDIRKFLAANPGAKYMHALSTGCSSLQTHFKGGVEIYAAYFGPYTGRTSACTKRALVGGDSFVRRLDNTSSPDQAVSCG